MRRMITSIVVPLLLGPYFVPEDTAAFRKVARKAGWKLSPRKTGFLIEGEDEPGAFLHLVSRLAEAKINVTAAAAVCAGQKRYGEEAGINLLAFSGFPSGRRSQIDEGCLTSGTLRPACSVLSHKNSRHDGWFQP